MKLKKSIGKNQVIITALAVMIAVAGYINYSGNLREMLDAKVREQRLSQQMI